MDTSKSKIKNQKLKIKLGFSPCPNDIFIFEAIVNKRIDTEGLEFKFTIADVEELNKLVLGGNIEVSKLSFFCYGLVWETYQLLNSGSALGYNCGPLLISNKNYSINDVKNLNIALPGEHTTANFLFSMAFPDAVKKKFILFSDIEEAVLNGSFDAGVIIHENRFTYEQKGLKKIIDLGEYWEEQTKLPVPLGGIAIKRSLDAEIKCKIDRIIRKSIEYAFAFPDLSLDFIRKNAQSMSDEIIRKHIHLYVNDLSISLDNKGKETIMVFYKKASELKLIPKMTEDIFI